MENSSTFLGTVQDVSGTNIRMILENESLSGSTFVDGQGYRIGQIGSFVKIPIGYSDLFGIVSQVGASAIPENLSDKQPYSNRWMTIQLIGEGERNKEFTRGISQYPTIGDSVHLVSEKDLERIYGHSKEKYYVKIGNIAGADAIPALLDINKLVTRHSAILGTTGSGKSTTVASILNSLSNIEDYPSARIVVLDIHGEYGKALSDRANTYKINAESNIKFQQKELYLPFWALSFDELVDICFGNLGDEKNKSFILERVLYVKESTITKYPCNGVDQDNLSVDSPVPFSLNKLWHDLYSEQFATYYGGKKAIKENWAYELDEDGKPIIGDPEKGIPPRFKQVKNIADEEKIFYVSSGTQGTLNIRSQLETLGSKLRIPRYDFLFKPGLWKPDLDGKVTSDLDELLKDWLGSDKPITILDLSGVPNIILNTIIGVLLRILYDALFWSRNLSQGGRNRPLLIVMEEAHNYLNDDTKGIASTIVQRIVKEGRKYGIGAMIVSQRPSEINSTVLSQCGTFIAMRLANEADRGHVSGVVSDNLAGLTSMLPILKTGEAIILGESVRMPMRTIIDAPPYDKRPDSQDPKVYDELDDEHSEIPGGWNIPMEKNPRYDEVVQVWRAQKPNAINRDEFERRRKSIEEIEKKKKEGK
jgi:uncharacterized protein